MCSLKAKRHNPLRNDPAVTKWKLSFPAPAWVLSTGCREAPAPAVPLPRAAGETSAVAPAASPPLLLPWPCHCQGCFSRFFSSQPGSSPFWNVFLQRLQQPGWWDQLCSVVGPARRGLSSQRGRQALGTDTPHSLCKAHSGMSSGMRLRR